MKVILNGKEQELPEGISIQDLMKRYQLRPEMTVVEINLEIIRRKEYENTVLKSDDKVEFVTMMGGG